MFLYEKHCAAAAPPTLLSKEQINLYLKEIPSWDVDLETKEISCTYTIKNYHQNILFINTISEIIHNENHHPKICFGYDYCSIHFSTHSSKGITLFDFICAAKIERTFLTLDDIA